MMKRLGTALLALVGCGVAVLFFGIVTGFLTAPHGPADKPPLNCKTLQRPADRLARLGFRFWNRHGADVRGEGPLTVWLLQDPADRKAMLEAVYCDLYGSGAGALTLHNDHDGRPIARIRDGVFEGF